MKTYKFLLLLFVVILLTVGITSFIYGIYAIYDVKEFKIYLEVADVEGIKVDTDAIYFGKIPPSGVGQRNIIISHEHDKPLLVHIGITGDVKRFVAADENDFWLAPGEEKEVKILAVIPEGTEFSNYTGSLRTVLRRI